jgi:vacuolar-type H+-ATPase subunit E/Vma4
MSSHIIALCLLVSLAPVAAQDTAERTAPFTAAERESVYAASIQKRAEAILNELRLADTNKATRVHNAILVQYRALRARDEALDAMFQSLSSNIPGIATNRPQILPILSRQLHDQFLKRLGEDLRPEQVEVVKDKMTYNKVQVTYDAYCQIFPAVTDKHKAKILESLKIAREEAMDGGSAPEKSAIFQKYKDQINAYLEANGFNVAQAYKDWEAKQGNSE